MSLRSTKWRIICEAARRGIVRGLDLIVAFLTAVFSAVGVMSLGLALLVGGAITGWVETPLQGVIRGYAYPLASAVPITAGLTNAPRVASFGTAFLVAVALVAVARWRLVAPWLVRHVGAALIVVVLSFPVALVARRSMFVEDLVAQALERDAIRSFAALVDGYADLLHTIELPGTATLSDRIATVLELSGWGWWFALVGAILLTAAGCVAPRRPRGLAFSTGWATVAVVTLAAVAAPAVRAEYSRLRGEHAFASGSYGAALIRYRAAQSRDPQLRENASFQYRLGATYVSLGNDRSPAARFFLAENLKAQQRFEQAELELRLALAADPDWRLARRRLAELSADWGVDAFRRHTGGEIQRWERAIAIDATLLRVPYYLAHAYYLLDDRDQHRALGQGQLLVSLTLDKVLLADLYQRLGDCYFKEHREDEARRMYRVSLATVTHVKRLNLKAQEGLLGL